ncbi:unnamed protein product, partial [Prorocentrum cordatum]
GRGPRRRRGAWRAGSCCVRAAPGAPAGARPRAEGGSAVVLVEGGAKPGRQGAWQHRSAAWQRAAVTPNLTVSAADNNTTSTSTTTVTTVGSTGASNGTTTGSATSSTMSAANGSSASASTSTSTRTASASSTPSTTSTTSSPQASASYVPAVHQAPPVTTDEPEPSYQLDFDGVWNISSLINCEEGFANWAQDWSDLKKESGAACTGTRPRAWTSRAPPRAPSGSPSRGSIPPRSCPRRTRCEPTTSASARPVGLTTAMSTTAAPSRPAARGTCGATCRAAGSA